MTFLFIRHSLAVDKEEFSGHDFDRPLTEKGIKRAKRLFRGIKKVYEIDYIITSTAKRALQTAEILSSFYKDAIFIKTSKLLPGANVYDLKDLIKDKNGVIAIVGHEPDLSEMIKEIMYSPNLKIKLSKPSIVEIDNNILKALLSYKHFKGIE